MILATFITDTADQAVILPLIAAVAVALLLQRRWRAAAAWLFAMAAVLGMVLILKLLLGACGWQIPAFGAERLNLRSPSGHTASAAAVAGGLAALLAPRRPISAWVALLAAAAIGATRLILGAHSMAEVLAATVVGVAGAMLMARLLPQTRRRPAPVLAATTFVIVLFHGRHLPAEAMIHGRGVALVRAIIPACQPP